MRQAHSKRSRNRGRKVSNNPNRTFDSNGPDVKIRGSASQIFEKYQSLARDASSSGDYIAAENFYQHAEHYFRVLSANSASGGGAQANGAGREAQNHPSSDGGRQPHAAQGPNGGGRGNGRGRRNVGSVRPNGEGKSPPPQDPGSGPQPVVPAPDGEQPQNQQPSQDTPGS
ncbi:MAG: DUF4167 domain-containing protein [Alphaproteobacteria bacterium]